MATFKFKICDDCSDSISTSTVQTGEARMVAHQGTEPSYVYVAEKDIAEKGICGVHPAQNFEFGLVNRRRASAHDSQ